jgi:DNA-directed RNA polymerase subunit RPC12/RpoP
MPPSTQSLQPPHEAPRPLTAAQPQRRVVVLVQDGAQPQAPPVQLHVLLTDPLRHLMRLYELTTHLQWRQTDDVYVGERLLRQPSAAAPLRQLGLTDGTLVRIERCQQAGSEYFEYWCANPRCAQVVRLRRDDVVVCRRCDGRLLSKPPTEQPRTYCAR